jgi:hypothetical protein
MAQPTQFIALAKARTGWGYIDINGEFQIEPRFTRAFGMGEHGHAMIVSWRERLDLSQEFLGIIKLGDFNYDPLLLGDEFDTESFRYSRFKDGAFCVEESGGFSYIDTSGNPLFDYIYDFATPFDNGKATASSEGYCYIVSSNKTDSLVLEGICKMPRQINQGIAVFEGVNGKFGAMDSAGRMIIEPKFKQLGDFHAGFASAAMQRKRVGYVDVSGNWTVAPRYLDCKDFDPASGMARVKDDTLGWIYVDTAGVEMIVYGLNLYGDFSEGLASGKSSSGYGFFDKTGKWVIPPQFQAVRNFKNGYAAAKYNGFWGFIDKQGRWQIMPQFIRVKDFEAVKL